MTGTPFLAFLYGFSGPELRSLCLDVPYQLRPLPVPPSEFLIKVTRVGQWFILALCAFHLVDWSGCCRLFLFFFSFSWKNKGGCVMNPEFLFSPIKTNKYRCIPYLGLNPRSPLSKLLSGRSPLCQPPFPQCLLLRHSVQVLSSRASSPRKSALSLAVSVNDVGHR